MTMKKIIFIIIPVLIIGSISIYFLTRPHPEKINYLYDDSEGITVEVTEVFSIEEFNENFEFAVHRVQVLLTDDRLSDEEINQQLEENPYLSPGDITAEHYESLNNKFITKHNLEEYNPSPGYSGNAISITFDKEDYSEILSLILRLSKYNQVTKIIFFEYTGNIIIY